MFEALMLRSDPGKFCIDFFALEIAQSTEIRIIPVNGRRVLESSVILTPTPSGKDLLQHCFEAGTLHRLGWSKHFTQV